VNSATHRTGDLKRIESLLAIAIARVARTGTGGITRLTGDVLAGPGTGSQAATVVRVNGSTVPAGGALTTGNVLQVTGAAALGYAPVNLAGGANFVTGVLPAANQASQTMAGDVTGTTGANTVVALQNRPLSNAAPALADVIAWNGAGWAPAVPASGGITQLTGDVLAGPGVGSQAGTVVAVNGSTVPAGGALTTGNVLQVTGAAALGYAAVNLAGGANFVTGVLPAANQASQTMGGDVTGTTAASTVAKVNGSTVPAGGALTTGNVLQVTGAAALGYAAVNLAGGAAHVTGVLPAANQASQTMGGDVTGTTAASTVVALQGNAVSSSAPTTAYPMIWSGSAWGPGGNIDFANKYAKNLQTATFDQELANGNSGAAFTINWTSAQKQTITLNANCTFTFTSPNGPCNMVLRLVQDAVGSRTVTWPATVKWVGAAAPTLTTSANAVDIVSLYWNGTNYYASYGLNFA